MRDRTAKHVFQAHGLGSELYVVMLFLPFGTVFEFHRIDPAVRVEFDQVGLPDEAKPVAPQWQSALYAYA